MKQVIFFHGSTFDENTVFPFNDANNILSHPKYDSNRKTVIYVHGYAEAPSNESIHVIVDSYLTRSDFNIIIYDWSKGAFGNYLLSAVGNAVSLGKSLSTVLINLFNAGLSVERFSSCSPFPGRANGRRYWKRSHKPIWRY